MDSGPVVVDISSDEEPDECRVDMPLEFFIQLLNEDGGEGVNNDIVDVDQYFNSVENSDHSRPKSCVRDESDDDCMVLDGDPDKPVEVGDDKRNGGDAYDDLQIVGQKGQVACRDFPHSRHLCANFPFNTTSHEKHCKFCHCFVCDSRSPCTYWGNGFSLTDHCHATDKDDTWKAQRKLFKKTTLPQKPKHPFQPPVRIPQSISRPSQVPRQIQTSKESPLRACSTTSSSRYIPTERHHQNHQRLIQTLPVHRENNHSLAVSRTVSHTLFKKVATPRSDLRSSSLNRSQSTNSGRHRMPRYVLQRPQHPPKASLGPQQWPHALPRAQSMPITSERSSCTPMVSSEDDTVKGWQDILAGVAAELGVSNSISKSSTTSQPYTASFQSPAIYAPGSNQGIELHNDLGSTTIASNSLDFDPKWLDGATDQIFPERSDSVCGDINIESFFTAEEEILSAPEKGIGAPEVDSSSFLYDFDGNWSNPGNV